MAMIQFRLPEYCDTYKHFLVEELVYIQSPALLHYGKCAVIGQIIFENSKYFLSNVRLNCLGKKYIRNTDSTRILLLPSMQEKNPLPVGSTVEILAETCLWNIKNDAQRHLPDNHLNIVTSHHLICNLQSMQTELEESEGLPTLNLSGTTDKSVHPKVRFKLDKYLHEMRLRLVSALKIHHVRFVDRAEEVIEANLRLRLVSNNNKKK